MSTLTDQLSDDARAALSCPAWCVAPDDEHIYDDGQGGVFVQHRSGPVATVTVVDADEPDHRTLLHLALVQNAATGGELSYVGFPSIEVDGRASLRLRAEAAFELGKALILLAQQLEDDIEPSQRAALSFLQRLTRGQVAS